MNRLRAGISAGGVLLLALCGPFSAAPAHAQGDPRRAAPPPGKALVFVFRSDREPRAAQMPVTVNAEHAGDLANGAFLVATVDPGRTFLRAGDRVLSSLSFEAAANQSYFVRLEAVHGMTVVHTELRLVSEAEGRSSLAQSSLAAAMPAAAAAAPGALQAHAVVEPAATQPAASPQARAPAAPGGGWTMVFIPRGGRFKLAQPTQAPGGVPITFDDADKRAYSIEIEGRSESGFAAGGEIFYTKNDLVLNGTGLIGDQQVAAILVNAKYYLRAASWLYPYLGAGVGTAVANYGGDLTGRAAGAAFQGVAGVELRFGFVGLNLQYKRLSSTTKDKDGVEVKVGGTAVLGALSVTF